ncbi:MAG: hypothetical protein ACRDXB_21410 [Actinomycetes bacterium]
MTDLCPECFELRQRWVHDYPLNMTGWIAVGGNRGERALEQRRYLVDQWKATIDYQCRLIARICRDKHQVDAMVVDHLQLALPFDLSRPDPQ